MNHIQKKTLGSVLQEKIEQNELLKYAFEYVRGKQDKSEKDNISIADVLHYSLHKDTEKKDKISLCWCAICMIKHCQYEMEYTDEEVKSLTDNIMKKLDEDLRK